MLCEDDLIASWPHYMVGTTPVSLNGCRIEGTKKLRAMTRWGQNSPLAPSLLPHPLLRKPACPLISIKLSTSKIKARGKETFFIWQVISVMSLLQHSWFLTAFGRLLPGTLAYTSGRCVKDLSLGREWLHRIQWHVFESRSWLLLNLFCLYDKNIFRNNPYFPDSIFSKWQFIRQILNLKVLFKLIKILHVWTEVCICWFQIIIPFSLYLLHCWNTKP